jgi:hypothetical protein
MGSISQILHDKFNELTDYEKIGGRDSAIAAEKIKGLTVTHKFGGGIVQTTERVVWDNMASADYPFKFTNTTMTVVSNNVLDTGQSIIVYYIELVGADWVYKKGIATTDGTTPATILEADDDFVSIGSNAQIMFPYRMSNRGTGQNTGNLAGVLTCANGGITYAQIRNGYNQTLMAVFPIATGYSGFVHGVGRSVIGSAKACTFIYAATEFGRCRQAKIVTGLTDGAVDTQFDLPYFFEEKTILTVRAKIDTGTADVNASFDVVLVKNENINIL